MQLPGWLSHTVDYVAPRDRDSFLRRNVLALAGLLEAFRAAPPAKPASVVERSLARVSPAVRLVCVLALVVCVSAARNFAFCWVLLALLLARMALCPAADIAGALGPAFALALVAAVVSLPAALWMGQTAAPVRLAIKSFVTMGVVAGMAQGLGVTGVLDGLRALRMPARLVFTLDVTMRDLGLLGEAAKSLSEALELRSIGRATNKTAGTAGVLGATFLRGQRLATGQAEAMLLRGYDGEAPRRAPERRVACPDLVCLVAAGALVALFFYLEGAV